MSNLGTFAGRGFCCYVVLDRRVKAGDGWQFPGFVKNVKSFAFKLPFPFRTRLANPRRLRNAFGAANSRATPQAQLGERQPQAP
jgi:hypothetical protein